MAVEEAKIAQVSASEKNSPGASIQDDSDREWQKTQYQGGEGTFDAVEGHHFYRPIDSYEGLHRWDPDFQWTEDEEKKIVRKVFDLSFLTSLMKIELTLTDRCSCLHIRMHHFLCIAT